MFTGEHDGLRLNGGNQRARRPDQLFNYRECGFNLFPLPTQLAPRDAGELIEDVYADDTTVGKQRLGLSAARLIGGEGVNQNIGVEDTARRPSRPTWN